MQFAEDQEYRLPLTDQLRRVTAGPPGGSMAAASPVAPAFTQRPVPEVYCADWETFDLWPGGWLGRCLDVIDVARAVLRITVAWTPSLLFGAWFLWFLVDVTRQVFGAG